MDILKPYHTILDLDPTSLSLISHQDALVANVYRVTRNHQDFILKICPRAADYQREIYFLNYFADLLPTPRIIGKVDPQEGLFGAVLMTALNGDLLNQSRISEKMAYETGSILAIIHQQRAEGFGDIALQLQLKQKATPAFTEKFLEGIEECRPRLSESIINQCLNGFKEHIDLLESVDGPCLTHRDFRPGNLMADQNCFQGVIDWSSARASFAEEDLSTLENGEWQNFPYAKKPFLRGYASIRPIPPYQKLLPLLALNKAVGAIGFTVKKGIWNTTHKDFYRAYYALLNKALKLLTK
ncbi:MAG: aminoglycoside phosphotransferase family protein [Parachlamydiaceae bacterium]